MQDNSQFSSESRPYHYQATNQPDQTQAELYREAEARVKAKTAFYLHLITYIVVNGFLWILALPDLINRPVGDWGVPWPVYPMAGWGIAILLNALQVYGYSRKTTRRMIEEEMRRMQDRS